MPAARIHVTGNTVIDALREVVDMIATRARRSRPSLTRASPSSIPTGRSCSSPATAARISAPPFLSLCEAIADLVRTHPIQAVYPVHLNPNVQEPVRAVLGGVDHVHLIEPLDYLPFVYLMQRSHVILTDSGGIQEEAPSLGKPVFVMRNVTERPEAVEAGTVRLVGTDRERIFAAVSRGARPTRAAYDRMSRAHNPYGDGHAAATHRRHPSRQHQDLSTMSDDSSRPA